MLTLSEHLRDELLGDDEPLRPRTVLARDLDGGVVELRVHRERDVARQGPRRRRPREKGLALDTTRRRLYVGSPATQSLFVVDIAADPPTASTFLMGAGQPNGLTIDADGNVVYSDFGG